MRIKVEKILSSGIQVEVTPQLEWAVDVARSVLEAELESLAGELDIQREGSRIQVRGQVVASANRVCERCGETTRLELGGEVDLVYLPEKFEDSGSTEVRLEQRDLDVGWYSEGVLDMGAALSEALALTLPPRIQCADVPGCDDRVSAMLSAANQPDEGALSPFAVLGRLN